MRNVDELIAALSKSKFRSRFVLGKKEVVCLRERGIDTVLAQGRKIISERLAPAEISNDGRQTPWRNHPVFVAQHATATCCRQCLQKWHGIEKGRQMSQEEIDYVLAIIRQWLANQQIAEAPLLWGK